MKLPVVDGLIRRRILVNYRADPQIVARLLPPRLRPQVHAGNSLVGICLIRLEQVRPRPLPARLGIQSENAAHRFAVEWDDDTGARRNGVFVHRRDTSSWLNCLAGGRVFPGEHHLAKFDVAECNPEVALSMHSRDGKVAIEVSGHAVDTWPRESTFTSLASASAFYERGSLGYSTTDDPHRLDGLVLKTAEWAVQPFAIDHVASSYFDDDARFPPGSIALDHALLMRDVRHQWHGAPDLCV